MTEIKENGCVRWRAFLLTLGAVYASMGGLLLVMFFYVDSHMIYKEQFVEFRAHVLVYLQDIKESQKDLRDKVRGP